MIHSAPGGPEKTSSVVVWSIPARAEVGPSAKPPQVVVPKAPPSGEFESLCRKPVFITAVSIVVAFVRCVVVDPFAHFSWARPFFETEVCGQMNLSHSARAMRASTRTPSAATSHGHRRAHSRATS